MQPQQCPPQQCIKLQDGTLLIAPTGFLAHCTNLRGSNDDPIHVNGISLKVMAHILEYYGAPNRQQGIRDICMLPMAVVWDVAVAADTLGATRLLDDVCSFIGQKMKGMEHAGLGELLGVPTDMTATDVRTMRTKLEWAVPADVDDVP
jgi:hypothetical protein